MHIVSADVALLLQYDYGHLLNQSHQFYRSQWVGTLPADYPHEQIPWRYNAFENEAGPTSLRWGKNMAGGIMEGGEAGDYTIQTHEL